MFTTKLTQKLDAAIRFFMYLLIFWLPYSLAVVEISVTAGFILWLIKRTLIFFQIPLRDRSWPEKFRVLGQAFQIPQSDLNLPIVCFLAAGLVSVIGSILFSSALYAFFCKILEWFIIYFLMLEVMQERKHLRIAMVVFAITSAGTILDGLWQFHVTRQDIFFGYSIKIDGRATAGFKHSNNLAAYLLYVIPFFLTPVLWFKKRGVLSLIGFAMGLWLIGLTFSRGAWIALGITLLFFLSNIHKKIFYAGTCFFVTVLLIFVVKESPQLQKQIRPDLTEVHSAMVWRSQVWLQTIKMIRDRPLFGHGINSYMKLFQKYRKTHSTGSSYNPTYAHNCFVQFAAEMGLFGLLSFLWILQTFFANTFQRIKHFKTEDPLKLILIAWVSGTVGFLIQSLMDTNFFSVQLSALFWMFLGLCVAGEHLLQTPAIVPQAKQKLKKAKTP